MSGTGTPKPITALLIDRPFVDQNGVLQPWAAQVLLRLQGYVGAPSGGSDTNITENLTDQLGSLVTNQYLQLGAFGSDASMQSRVMALENAVSPLAPFLPAKSGAHIPPLAPTWLSNGQEAVSEGTGTPVLDPVRSTSTTAFFRSLIGMDGITVAPTTDGTGIIIALSAVVDLTSNGSTVTSAGTIVTSGL